MDERLQKTALPSVDVSALTASANSVSPKFQIIEPRAVHGSVLQGSFEMRRLRPGLVLHVSDAVDQYDLVTRTEQQPGMTLQIFLKGTIDASVGGRPLMHREAAEESDRPRALIISRRETATLERRGHRGDHIRKVSLRVTNDWLNQSGLDLEGTGEAIDRFSQEHLARHVWTPGPRLIALAEHILEAAPSTAPLSGLFLESQALELLAESLMPLATGNMGGSPDRLDARDLRRLRKVDDFLEASDALVPLEEIAKASGVSVSTLQRLFQTVHGVSAFEYIRRRNLERARVALDRDRISVKEAAFLAGYSSAANFSTAFRKMFGRTPRQCRNG